MRRRFGYEAGCRCSKPGAVPGLPCTNCQSGTVSAQYLITIPPIANSTCDCSNIPGSYVVDQDAILDPCQFIANYDIDMGACGVHNWAFTLAFRQPLGGFFDVDLFLQDGTNGDVLNWRSPSVEGIPADCSGPFSLPYITPGFISSNCIWAGLANATVEAVT